MNASVQKPQGKTNNKILIHDVDHALRELVRLSKKLVDFADQETQSLIKGDHLGFAMTQQEKESLAVQYTKASEEFRDRLEDFRTADKGILMQLDKLQTELKEKTENNNMLIDQIKTRATANTQSTLFTAQEMGQRVHFPEKDIRAEHKEERASS